jgi:integrase
MGIERLKEPKPREIRRVIENIPDVIEIPVYDNVMKVDGRRLKLLDKFLYITGCRISEAVTRRTKDDRVTGDILTTSEDEFNDIDVAIWNFSTLKRKTGLNRSVALPMDDRYEPWAEEIYKPMQWENPFTMSRHIAYQANRIIFNGLGYIIEPQLVKRRDGTVIFEADKHMKHSSNHFLRHVRSRELTVDYGFTDNDLMTFFGWSPVSFGKNTYMQRYQNLRWQDYFPKLLKMIK